MASTYLTRTFAQAGNRRTFTISYWIKMSDIDTVPNPAIMDAAADGSNSDDLYIHSGRLNFSGYYGSTQYIVRTTAVYRDPSGWYHHVIRFDTTQATASDRLRLYVNGELQTALDNNTYPSQNFETSYFNTARQHTIGSFAYGIPNTPFDGSMSHFHFCDGQSYAPTEFGEYDANGVWKINTSPSVTYGTNGFFILKDGNSVTDQSGNGNNFTVGGGTLTNTEDSPSNVFCTWNALDKHASSTLSNGNTKYATSGTSQYEPAKCTLGFSSGKYYSEHQINSLSTTGCFIGIYGTSVSGQSQSEMDTSRFCYNVQNGEIIKNASNLQTGLATFTTNDILGIEVDCDAGTLKFYKNGTQVGTTITDSDISSTEWTFGTQPRLATFSSNFGNGYFGTTAVASAGTNASGIGIFEYDVPTGYTALSTKGLNL
jgi:hypothetical protein